MFKKMFILLLFILFSCNDSSSPSSPVIGLCDSCILGSLQSNVENSCEISGCNNVIEIGIAGEVFYSLDSDFVGFQFDIKGGVINSIITNDTDSENLVINYSEIPPIGENSYTIIAYDYSENFQNKIDSGCGTLMIIDFDNNYDQSLIEVSNIIFIDSDFNTVDACNNN